MDYNAGRSPAAQRVIQSTSKYTPSTSRNSNICPSLQRRFALQPDKTQPGRVQRRRERKSRIDRRSTALRPPFQPARNASRLCAVGYSCRHTAISSSSYPPETAPESPWHCADEGARPQLRPVTEYRPGHREDRRLMQLLPTAAKTAVQGTSSSVAMARSSVATSARRLHQTFPRIVVSSASRHPLKMARSCPPAEHHTLIWLCISSHTSRVVNLSR